ncbi:MULTISPECIES: hypothetical protein [Klebsiella pneumoniae complex]|uniref:hypothetical protein n=1 Tax=Klebsiella pneumoniae complex TaxID=3390273 RepID=UPI0003BF0EBC|nr:MULTISPECIES: hypothetical protein [Klebsiella]ESN58766.1 hypothetical protein L363_02139 [Klebsiella pneumoniae MGH 17]SAS59297.1 Uncharacterised protein [Klebsiella variicola]HCB1082700.1 hypothetical protein [Klebsiella variicola subsp. variicola]
MVDLEQIKADIAARKAMPEWGPQTSIERIRTINATLPSFSLKTVETLAEMLEKSQLANAAQDDHINQQQDRIDQLEKRNAELGKYARELESRTVKLPKLKMLEDYLAEVAIEERKQILVGVKLEFHRALATAGIKWEV